mgnify:CR=1 FL=1
MRGVLSRRGFDAFVVKLPAATLHEQWDSSVAKVGGKVFALVGAFTPEEIQANLAALDLPLTPAECDWLDLRCDSRG